MHKYNAEGRAGFTIVELLIVIVIIAILATISIVTYNGIQARAENAKTVQAVSAWVKAMKMYKAKEGIYPAINTCLGATDTYTASHNGVCWGADTATTWQVKPSLNAALGSYINTSPEPSSKNIGSATSQYRGAMYYYSSPGGEEIRVSIIDAQSSADCPAIGGLGDIYSSTKFTSGVSCYYRLP